MQNTRPGHVVEFLFALATVVGLALASDMDPGNHLWNMAAAAVSMIVGARVFLGHGGDRVTVLGVFSFVMALVGGFAGFYAAATDDPRVSAEYLNQAILACLTLQVLTAGIGWRRGEVPPPALPDPKVSAWMARWGVVSLVGLAAATTIGLTDNFAVMTEAAAFSAIVCLTIGLIYREGARLVSWRSLTVLAALLAYATVFHTGGGRLRIIALACAVLLIVSARWPRRALKRLAILATPAALYLLALQRLSLQESLQFGSSAGRNGLESMLVPIVVFGRLLEEQAAGMTLAWGWNLLSVPLSFLPAGWVENPPQALGYELVTFYAPSKHGSGFSLAATAAGEAAYNFGLLGAVVAAPVLALLCNFLDRRMRLAAAQADKGRMGLVRFAFWAALGGGVPDLAWNGWHIFVTRALMRMPLLGALAVLAFMDRTLTARALKARDRALVNRAKRTRGVARIG